MTEQWWKKLQKRRNGSVYRKSDGELGLGPFTMQARKKILKKLLELEEETNKEREQTT